MLPRAKRKAPGGGASYSQVPSTLTESVLRSIACQNGFQRYGFLKFVIRSTSVKFFPVNVPEQEALRAFIIPACWNLMQNRSYWLYSLIFFLWIPAVFALSSTWSGHLRDNAGKPVNGAVI